MHTNYSIELNSFVDFGFICIWEWRKCLVGKFSKYKSRRIKLHDFRYRLAFDSVSTDFGFISDNNLSRLVIS